MSEQNKNRNKNKGRQNQHNQFERQNVEYEEAIPEDTEYLNINNKKNKRHGRN